MKTTVTKKGYFVIFLTFYMVIKILKHFDFKLNASINSILADLYIYGTNWFKKDKEKLVYIDVLLSALENYVKNEEL